MKRAMIRELVSLIMAQTIYSCLLRQVYDMMKWDFFIYLWRTMLFRVDFPFRTQVLRHS